MKNFLKFLSWSFTGICLVIILYAFSERHFLIRYFSYNGDPLTNPISWFDPTEVVNGSKNDNLFLVPDDQLTISKSILDEISLYAESQSSLALIVVHNGIMQLEKYWGDAERSVLFNPQSMSKTVLGILVGIAINEGYIDSLDDSVGKYIEEWNTDERGKITIHQALQMSAGLEQMSTSYDLSIFNKSVRHHFGTNFDKMTLDLEQNDPPGTKYEYNNEETNLLGIVLERATGKRYADYLSSRLWKPLELGDAKMYLDRKNGSVMKSCCILSRPYDWAKLGSLFIQKGEYNGKTIVPESWINQMITPSLNKDFYGLQVWLGSNYIPPKNNNVGVYDSGDPPLYLDDEMIVFVGFGGQRTWVSPKYNLVIVYATKHWANAWVEAKIPNSIISSLQ